MVGLRVNRPSTPTKEGTAMKTVPTVRLADTTDAVVLPDLPEEIALALADIAGVAREGLLAMSVATGMAVMAAMFEAEIAAACGPKGKHDPGRNAVRHGTGKGSVTLGGRRVPWIGRGRAPSTATRYRSRRMSTSPPTTCSRWWCWSGCWPGWPPAARPGCRAGRQQVVEQAKSTSAARRFRAGSCARPRPRWPS